MSPQGRVPHDTNTPPPDRSIPQLPYQRPTPQASGIRASVHVPVSGSTTTFIPARELQAPTHPFPESQGPASLSATALAFEHPDLGFSLQRWGSMGMNPWVDGPSATAATAAAAAAIHRQPRIDTLDRLEWNAPWGPDSPYSAGMQVAYVRGGPPVQNMPNPRRTTSAVPMPASPASTTQQTLPQRSTWMATSRDQRFRPPRLAAAVTAPASAAGHFPRPTQPMAAPDSGFRAARPSAHIASISPSRGLPTAPFPHTHNTAAHQSVQRSLHVFAGAGSLPFLVSSTQRSNSENSLAAQNMGADAFLFHPEEQFHLPASNTDSMEESDEGEEEDVDEWGTVGHEWNNTIVSNISGGHNPGMDPPQNGLHSRDNNIMTRDLAERMQRFHPTEAQEVGREAQRTALEQRWVERGESFGGRRVRQRADGGGIRAGGREIGSGEMAFLNVVPPPTDRLEDVFLDDQLQLHERAAMDVNIQSQRLQQEHVDIELQHQRQEFERQQLQQMIAYREMYDQNLLPQSEMQQLQHLMQLISPTGAHRYLTSDGPYAAVTPAVAPELKAPSLALESGPCFQLPLRTVQPCSYLAAGQVGMVCRCTPS